MGARTSAPSNFQPVTHPPFGDGLIHATDGNPLLNRRIIAGTAAGFTFGLLTTYAVIATATPDDASEVCEPAASDRAYMDCRFDRIDERLGSIEDPSVEPEPSEDPSEEPSEEPTDEPTEEPTDDPIVPPTTFPTVIPEPRPTSLPTATTGPVDVQPVGQTGWRLTFGDDFTADKLSSSWAPSWFNESKQNNVYTDPDNVAVKDGELVLTLASAASGASINTNPDDAATDPFEFTYGYAEARIWFPGDGATIYNWPAWWTNGQNHPEDGEHDIAEGLGQMTVNYHSDGPNSKNHGVVPGTWSNGWHTYGINRQPGKAEVFFDGKLVKSYETDDAGSPHYLILTVGNRTSAGGRNVYGAAGATRVDYVRVWNR